MRALVLTDLQNDFLPGGALAVPEGDVVVPVANALQIFFPLVVATQDWHPPNHGSFAANHPGKKVYDEIDLNGFRQTLWPVHCVQHSPGADFAPAMNRARVRKVFQKGVDPFIDSYSGFYDNAHRRSTGMGEWLKEQKVTDLYFCGLATDYCVKFSALDALKLGFRTFVVEDACRGVDVRPGDVERALAQIKSRGAEIVRSDQLKAYG